MTKKYRIAKTQDGNFHLVHSLNIPQDVSKITYSCYTNITETKIYPEKKAGVVKRYSKFTKIAKSEIAEVKEYTLIPEAILNAMMTQNVLRKKANGKAVRISGRIHTHYTTAPLSRAGDFNDYLESISAALTLGKIQNAIRFANEISGKFANGDTVINTIFGNSNYKADKLLKIAEAAEKAGQNDLAEAILAAAEAVSK
jgi:hypothetical protein